MAKVDVVSVILLRRTLWDGDRRRLGGEPYIRFVNPDTRITSRLSA